MDLEAQKRAPIYEALERFRKKRVVPFDVPVSYTHLYSLLYLVQQQFSAS